MIIWSTHSEKHTLRGLTLLSFVILLSLSAALNSCHGFCETIMIYLGFLKYFSMIQLWSAHLIAILIQTFQKDSMAYSY
jgi:hypothetical protein